MLYLGHAVIAINVPCLAAAPQPRGLTFLTLPRYLNDNSVTAIPVGAFTGLTALQYL